MAVSRSFNSANESTAAAESSNSTTKPTKPPAGDQESLSTNEILRVAARRIIGMSTWSHTIDLPSLMNNPFDLSDSSGLSCQDAIRVELVEYLLAAAEKVGNQHHDLAADLLDLCDCLSSETGDPVQRVVYYFSEALHERIDRESGRARVRVTAAEEAWSGMILFGNVPSSLLRSLHEKVPFYQVSHLSAVQILLENVGNSKRIHAIDVQIRSGLQWTAMMQALASRPDRTVELLKITALATNDTKNLIEDTGRRLTSFAVSINVPFRFEMVTSASSSDHLQPEMFDIDPREALAVYSEGYLSSRIANPDSMEALMKLLRNFNPRIVVVLEMEANHNSVTFAHRFVEALFSYAAVFDCLDCCMAGQDQDQDQSNRMGVESVGLRDAIRNVVAKEGEEREFRNVRIDVWRTLLGRFSLVESKMSAVVLYQAKLVLKRFPSIKRFCKVYVDGKSLILGWKDTPMVSISSWKFARLRKHKEDALGLSS
ncbi:DELLA protein DWARF8 [Linum grandiflorum]